MKTESNKIIFCSIVCRAESFREKGGKVNAHLEEIYAEKDIAIITHCDINPKRHLKLVSAIFYQIFISHQMILPQKI